MVVHTYEGINESETEELVELVLKGEPVDFDCNFTFYEGGGHREADFVDKVERWFQYFQRHTDVPLSYMLHSPDNKYKVRIFLPVTNNATAARTLLKEVE